jgi:hypothetical protein
MFDLVLPKLTPALGEQAMQAVADRASWPVHYLPAREERRWFRVVKAYPHVLELATEDPSGHVLVDPETWDEDRWRLRSDARPRLTATLRVLAELHPEPFDFRATWAGSPIEQDEELTVDELARLISADALHDHTRYRVWQPERGRPTAPGPLTS